MKHVFIKIIVKASQDTNVNILGILLMNMLQKNAQISLTWFSFIVTVSGGQCE